MRGWMLHLTQDEKRTYEIRLLGTYIIMFLMRTSKPTDSSHIIFLHIFTYLKLYYLSAWFGFVSEIDLPNKLEKVISHMYIRGTGQRVHNQREKVIANYEVTQLWDGQVNLKTPKKRQQRSTQLLGFGICTLCWDIRLDWIFFENAVQDARIPFVIIGIIKDTSQQIVGECIMSSCAHIDRFENWWKKRKRPPKYQAISFIIFKMM